MKKVINCEKAKQHIAEKMFELIDDGCRILAVTETDRSIKLKYDTPTDIKLREYCVEFEPAVRVGDICLGWDDDDNIDTAIVGVCTAVPKHLKGIGLSSILNRTGLVEYWDNYIVISRYEQVNKALELFNSRED